MDYDPTEIAVWLITGLLAGSLAGLVVKRKKEGFGWLTNLAFGLVGAAVGGFLFRQLGIQVGLPKITVDLNQVVAAFAGALIVVVLVAIFNRKRQKA